MAELPQLKSIRIFFTKKEDEERGFYALLTSGMPVQAIPNSRYIINETQCDMLTQLKIPYQKELQ
jgi:hypothetical protein